MFKVETPRMGGGTPMLHYFIVVGSTAADALAALRVKVEVPITSEPDFRPLPDAVIEFMNLDTGAVMPWAPA